MRATSRNYYRARKRDSPQAGAGAVGYGTTAGIVDTGTPPKGGGGGGGSVNGGSTSSNSKGRIMGGDGLDAAGVNDGGGGGGASSSSSRRRLSHRGGGGAESMSLLAPSAQTQSPGKKQHQHHYHQLQHQHDEQHQHQHQQYRHRRPISRKGKGYSSRAFVTFRSFGAATVARQVLHCARPGRMAAKSAPEPRDVYWPNAIVTRRQVRV